MKQRPEAAQCHHLDRVSNNYCMAPAFVVINYGSGIGACRKHIAPVLLWCMETDRGGQPERVVQQVVPASQWEDYKRYWIDAEGGGAT